MNNFKLKNFINETSDTLTSVSKYLPKLSYDEFQINLQKITNDLRTKIKSKVLGREVTFRGSKGFGQIIQSYTALISEVDIVLYQDKYILMFRGSEGKSKKQNEYYIDPTDTIYMKIRAGSVAPEPSNPVKPSPVISPDKVPAPKVTPLPSQLPPQSRPQSQF